MPYARLLSLLVGLAALIGCGDTTEPWSYAGDWAGENAALRITLRIDPPIADSASGGFSIASLSTGFNFATVTPMVVYSDSLVFDALIPAQLGYGSVHAKVTRVGNGLSIDAQSDNLIVPSVTGLSLERR